MNLESYYNDTLQNVISKCNQVYENVVHNFKRFKIILDEKEKESDLDTLYYIYNNVHNEYKNLIIELSNYKEILHESIGQSRILSKVSRLVTIFKKLKQIDSNFTYLIENKIIAVNNLDKFRTNGYMYSAPSFMRTPEVMHFKNIEHKLNYIANEITNINDANNHQMDLDEIKEDLTDIKNNQKEKIKYEVLDIKKLIESNNKTLVKDIRDTNFLTEYILFITDSFERFSTNINNYIKQYTKENKLDNDSIKEKVKILSEEINDVYINNIEPSIINLSQQLKNRNSDFENKIDGIVSASTQSNNELVQSLTELINENLPVFSLFNKNVNNLSNIHEKLEFIENYIENFKDDLENKISQYLIFKENGSFDDFETKLNMNLNEKVNMIKDWMQSEILSKFANLSNMNEDIKNINDSIININEKISGLEKIQEYDQIGPKRRKLSSKK